MTCGEQRPHADASTTAVLYCRQCKTDENGHSTSLATQQADLHRAG
jgi:hypothetical protein